MATLPPYNQITGIFTTDDKHQDITKTEFDGQARPGQLVVDTTDYQVYVSNADGVLNPVGAAGNGTTGGSNTQIQFNDGGNFGGNPALRFIKTTGTTVIANAAITDLAVSGSVGTSLVPASNIIYDLGTSSQRWRDLYLSGQTIYLGAQTITSNTTHVIFNNDVEANAYAGDGRALFNIEAANIVGNIPAANTANTANLANVANTALSVAGANVTGTVGNANVALRAGTVTTNAQPNITSVGTLSSLTTAGNITTTGEVTISNQNGHGGPGYAGMFTLNNANGLATNPNKFIRLNNIGNLQIVNSAYTATLFDLDDSGKLTLRGGAALGSVANVTIDGGSNGQVLTTDGSGSLSWTDIAGANTGNITFDGTTISTNDVEAPITVVNPAGAINIVGQMYTQLQWAADPANTGPSDINVENGQFWVDGGGLTYAAYAPAGAGQTGRVTVNTDGDISATGNIVAQRVAANSNGDGTNFAVGDDAFIGDINQTNTLQISGQQDQTQAYVVFGNSDTNTLGRSGTGPLTYTGDFTVEGATQLGDVANVHITGGTNGQILKTDGTGNLEWMTVSGINTGNITFNGDEIGSTNDIVNIAANNYAQLQSGATYIYAEANVGAVEVDGNIWEFRGNSSLVLPGPVYTSTSPVGVRAEYGFIIHPSHNTGGTGPELAINYNDGIEITPLTNDYLAGGTTAAPMYIQGAYSTTAGVVPGSVVITPGRNTSDNTWGGVTLGETSGGTVTLRGPSVNLGNVSNLHISGGTNGQVLATNGTGGLSWTTVSGGGGNGSPAGSNTQLQYNDAGNFGADANLTYDSTTGILSASQIAATDNGNGTNILVGDDAYIGDVNEADTIQISGQQDSTQGYIIFGNSDTTKLGRNGSGPLTYGGNFKVEGSTDLGAVGNITITGGTSGQVLSTDGTGNLSWVAQGSGGGLPIANGDTEIDIPDPSGNIVFTTNATNQWTLGTDQVMTLPQGGTITETGIPSSLAGSTIALTPAGGLNADQRLLVYPTAGGDNNHLHLTSGNLFNTELYLGSDDLYVKLANTGNIVMYANDSTGNTSTWSFNPTGGTIFPTLTTQRGDVSSGSLTGQTLLFGNASSQAIITTPDGVTNGTWSSERIVINPGKGADGTSGEGGDIYLWAGRGGSGDSANAVTGGSGGDIKVRGGKGGGTNGDGGYIRIEAGDTASAGGASGYIQIIGGEGFGGSAGGAVTVTAGQGSVNGGETTINGGFAFTGTGGNVTITGGGSGDGVNSYGNINISSGASLWAFRNNGDFALPDGTVLGQLEGAGTTGIAAPIDTTLLIETSSTASGGKTWAFDTDGSTTFPNGAKLNNGTAYQFATDNTVTTSLDLRDANGAGFYTNGDGYTLRSNGQQNWLYGTDGGLTLPTISTGSGTDERATIKGQRKIIPAFHYSAEISGTTPTVCYTTSSSNIMGFKSTFMVQHSNGGFEMFDVVATINGINTYYTVSNRVKPPSISETTVDVVEDNGSMTVVLTLTSGSSFGYVTFDATEFGIAVD